MPQRLSDILLSKRNILPALLLALLCSAQSAFACPDINGLLDINCDGQVRIVCFGDSITYGTADSTGLGYPGNLKQLHPGVVVLNVGDPGEKTPQGKIRAAQIFAQENHADFIVILEGVNDYWLFYSATNTKNNLFNMVASGNNTDAVVLLAKLTQVKRTFQQPWVNSVNSAIGSATQVDFFSLGQGIISSDLLHPDASGYAEMADFLSDILIEQTALNRPADLDEDGIYDFAEPSFNTNPALADSDGDGLLDGEEVFTYHSDPNLTDTDGDGMDDGFEVNTVGSDPASNLPTPAVIQSIEALPSEL